MSSIQNNYKLIEKIGQGSFGITYKAQNKKDNKFYVIKQILIKGLKKEEIESIKNEAKILSSINNENVVKYYDSYISEDNYNIIMEYCEE